MRACLTFALFCIFASPLWAAPRVYTVDKANSTVGFGFMLGAQKLRGQFKEYDIDLVIDFQTVANSKVAVRLDVGSAKTPFPFIAQALRGPSVLDQKNHPTIQFKTQSVSGKGHTARLNGLATIKGVTKPLTLQAKLFRPKGAASDSLNDLIMVVTGTLDRRDYGADGFLNEVDAILNIDIRTRITLK